MRKVKLFMLMSLDGFISGPAGELDWEIKDEAEGKFIIPEIMEACDTILLGRVLFQGFEQAWPIVIGDTKSSPELVAFGSWIENTSKVIFSKNSHAVTWKKSDFVTVKSDEDIVKEVTKLKQATGKDLVLFGGVNIAQTFVRLDLVDEFWIKLQPIALGAGKLLFKDLTKRLSLKLLESKTFTSGVTFLKYQK